MNRVFTVFLFAFLITGLAFSQTSLGDFTMRGAATAQAAGEGLSARHSYLPLNSTAKVTNPVTGNQIEVTIDGRIDPSHNRIIDLSRPAAQALGIRSGDTIILTVSAPARRDPRERQAQLVEFSGSPIQIAEQPHRDNTPIYQPPPPPPPEPEPEQPKQPYQPPPEPYSANGNGKNNGRTTEIYILPPPPKEDDGGLSEFLAWLMAMTMDSRETREIREVREIRDAREARLDREARELREIRESQEMREIREAREAREAREIREARELREEREAREVREDREERLARERRIAQERQMQQRASRARPPRETAAPVSAKEPEETRPFEVKKIQTSADSIENQMPVNRLNMPVINLPPTFRYLDTGEEVEVDLNTLLPISAGGQQKSSADLRVSANQTQSMGNNRMPPVRPEALQILPGLPDRHSGRTYNLQIGSFSALEAANRAASIMKDVGFDVKIEYSGAVYRVMAVKIASSDVYTASVRLGALGFGQIWVRE